MVNQEAWCVIGDFNAVIKESDRMGGNNVVDSEIKEFAECIEACELWELRTIGAHFTWTNKTIWSRFDRVFVNHYWHAVFEYVQAEYLAPHISYHSPIYVYFPHCLRPKAEFKYCDMWSEDPAFPSLVQEHMQNLPRVSVVA